jgi:F-type H+-transporting ATPase subunit epsilon
MTKLTFDLVSPERLLMSAEANMVTVPGAEGDMGIMAGHAPVITTLRPGVVRVDGGSEGPDKIFVRGGFAEVTPSGLTVLAEEAIPLDALDSEALAREIRDAEEDVADAVSDAARQASQERLDHLRELAAGLGRVPR